MEERDRQPGQMPASPAPADDIVGPGTGGSPTSAGAADASRAEIAADEEVAALVEELERDDADARVDVGEAAEQAGTGTDR